MRHTVFAAKSLAILLTLGAGIGLSFGQGIIHHPGFVTFQNTEPNRPPRQPASFHLITNVDGTLLIGTQYKAELYYWDTTTGGLEPLAASISSFRRSTTSLPGAWSGPAPPVALPNGVGGVDYWDNGTGEIGDGTGTGPGYYPVTLRVRVWDSLTGSTWETATGAKGETADFVYTERFSAPPSPADAVMINQPGFQLHDGSNSPPVALCQNQVVVAGDSCTAIASVDHGSYDPDGDPITISQSPTGPYSIGTTPVMLTVTDSHGASAHCAATVTVIDNTPPVIICPLDITAEFTSEDGAIATFAPAIFDNCTTAFWACVPPSGSAFPIGATNVSCTAADSSGNWASCGFEVTVLGSLAVKQAVLRELMALAPSVLNQPERQKLAAAIARLRKSLQLSVWLDQTHLRQQAGQTAFEKETVSALLDLIHAKPNSNFVFTLQGFVDRLVRSDRLLAAVAIRDATGAGADTRKLLKAHRELAQGDRDVAQGEYEQGIEDYAQAWQQALQAARLAAAGSQQ